MRAEVDDSDSAYILIYRYTFTTYTYRSRSMLSRGRNIIVVVVVILAGRSRHAPTSIVDRIFLPPPTSNVLSLNTAVATAAMASAENRPHVLRTTLLLCVDRRHHYLRKCIFRLSTYNCENMPLMISRNFENY